MTRLTIVLAGVVAFCNLRGAWGQDKSTGDADLDRIVRLLKQNDGRSRKAAVDERAKRGEAAKAAARPLCNTIFDPSPIVAKAAFRHSTKCSRTFARPSPGSRWKATRQPMPKRASRPKQS